MLPFNDINSDIGVVLAGLVCLMLHEALVRAVLRKTVRRTSACRETFFLHPLIMERLNGIWLMGVLPLIFSGLNQTWLFWEPTLQEVLLILIAGIILTGFSALVLTKIDLSGFRTAVAKPGNNTHRILMNAFVWVFYLAAYEYLLRGLLLFPMHARTGTIPAVVINVLIYSAIHLKKGWLETTGALPFGVILCLTALTTGSFWPAYLLHLNLALSMEWYIAKKANTGNRLTFQKI